MVILKYIEILKHYVVYEELALFEVNYTSKTNRFIGKEITFVLLEAGCGGKRSWMKADRRYSYKIKL